MLSRRTLFCGAGAALGGLVFERFVKRADWKQDGGIVKHAPFIQHDPETLMPAVRGGGLTDDIVVRSITLTNKVDGSKRLGSIGSDTIKNGTITIKGTAELTYADFEVLAKLLRC